MFSNLDNKAINEKKKKVNNVSTKYIQKPL